MMSAFGHPAGVSVPLPLAEELRGSANQGSSCEDGITRRSVADIQVSPCGLFIAVLTPWGVFVYSNGQCRMLLGSCSLPRDSEVYGRLCCCCWAPDSSALFVSADPLACVCVFSISGTHNGSSGLLQPQLQKQLQQAPTGVFTGASAAASPAKGISDPVPTGIAADAPAPLGSAPGEVSWLLEGLATVVDTGNLASSGSESYIDGQDSAGEGEEEKQMLQPTAAENASTAEQAMHSFPSIITAYRPPNTSPVSVVFSLLLRLPVRPSALCCCSMQQQHLLLAGCSRQPALFWLYFGRLKQVVGCLYITDLLRVVRRAGVCPGNAGPPVAALAVAASGAATTGAGGAECTWATSAKHGATLRGSLGCSCSACGGRCCCALKRPAFQPTRTPGSYDRAAADAELRPSGRCRCLGRRRRITYLFHPKGYSTVTELLRLPPSAQDIKLLPDLPDDALFYSSAWSPRDPLPWSFPAKSVGRRKRSLRNGRAPHKCRAGSSAENNNEQPNHDPHSERHSGRRYRRLLQSWKFGGPVLLGKSQRHLNFSALISDSSSASSDMDDRCTTIHRHCNGKRSRVPNTPEQRTGICPSSATDTCAGPFYLGAYWFNAWGNHGDRVSAADAAAAYSRSSSDDSTCVLGWSRCSARPFFGGRRLQLLEQGREEEFRMYSLTDGALSDCERLQERGSSCGVRQLQLNRRLDILAVVTAAGQLLLLAWCFPLRGYTQMWGSGGAVPLTGSEGAAKHGNVFGQQRLDRPHQELQKPAGAAPKAGVADNFVRRSTGGRMLSPTSAGSNPRNRRKGWWNISIGAGLDGRISIGHSPQETASVDALPAAGCGDGSNCNANRKLKPWRPLGLQLRASAVCCCALSGEKSLVAAGLGSGEVEIYRLSWPRTPVQRTCDFQQPQQGQQRLLTPAHRNVERDGFTLFPHLLHVLAVPEDIKAAATAERGLARAEQSVGALSAEGAAYLQPQSVQSLQWTSDGAALVVRWLKGGTAVFSHTGRILFSLPSPPSASISLVSFPAAGDALGGILTTSPPLERQQTFVFARKISAASAAAVAAGAAAGSGQLCCWIMGSLSLLHVCSSFEAVSQLERQGRGTKTCTTLLVDKHQFSGSVCLDKLLEVSVVRSGSVTPATSSVDICGSRCATDLTDR